MKIILSRKGFDSSNGGCPSPIMSDGTLLSMPIPTDDDMLYSDICWNGMTYAEILKQLSPKRTFNRCHVDPDIRENRKTAVKDWRPAFGQIGAAQGVLKNAGVDKGDIFLFFGWFRPAEKTDKGYRFVSRRKGSFYDHAEMQVIYGYMQIGDIITDAEKIKEYYWHPHSAYTSSNNTLYIPSDNLSLFPELKGYGTLDFRKDRVLTMENNRKGTWDEYSFLMPEHIYGNRKNSAKGTGIYYSGIWQELVVYESEGLLDWVKQIIT